MLGVLGIIYLFGYGEITRNKLAITRFHLFDETMIEPIPGGDKILRGLNNRSTSSYKILNRDNFSIAFGFVIVGFTRQQNDTVWLETDIATIPTNPIDRTILYQKAINNVYEWRSYIPRVLTKDKVLTAFDIAENDGIPVVLIMPCAANLLEKWDGEMLISVKDRLRPATATEDVRSVQVKEKLVLDKERMTEGSGQRCYGDLSFPPNERPLVERPSERPH